MNVKNIQTGETRDDHRAKRGEDRAVVDATIIEEVKAEIEEDQDQEIEEGQDQEIEEVEVETVIEVIIN